MIRCFLLKTDASTPSKCDEGRLIPDWGMIRDSEGSWGSTRGTREGSLFNVEVLVKKLGPGPLVSTSGATLSEENEGESTANGLVDDKLVTKKRNIELS